MVMALLSAAVRGALVMYYGVCCNIVAYVYKTEILDFSTYCFCTCLLEFLFYNSAPALQTKEFVLTACNPTDIPAGLKTLVEGRDSPFKVDPREATLQPHESLPITVRHPCFAEAWSEQLASS